MLYLFTLTISYLGLFILIPFLHENEIRNCLPECLREDEMPSTLSLTNTIINEILIKRTP